jgi:hypothetical protein
MGKEEKNNKRFIKLAGTSFRHPSPHYNATTIPPFTFVTLPVCKGRAYIRAPYGNTHCVHRERDDVGDNINCLRYESDDLEISHIGHH